MSRWLPNPVTSPARSLSSMAATPTTLMRCMFSGSKTPAQFTPHGKLTSAVPSIKSHPLWAKMLHRANLMRSSPYSKQEVLALVPVFQVSELTAPLRKPSNLLLSWTLSRLLATWSLTWIPSISNQHIKIFSRIAINLDSLKHPSLLSWTTKNTALLRQI